MNNLQVIELKGQRVLTTKQLAELYETDPERIKLNYRYNKERYVIGKHIIPIEDDELREFKTRYQFNTSFKYAKCLYLWTEKGALLHAKSINTDKAWEVYDYLVDHYFRSEEIVRKQAQEEIRRQQACERGNLVVNIPENPKIQEAIRETQKYLIAVEVMLQEYSKYRSEADQQEECKRIKLMGMKFYNKLCDAVEIKPQLVKKVL